LEVPPFSRETFLKIERARAAEICGPDRRRYAELYETLAAMREMTKATGRVQFAVMLIPDEFQVEDALWDGVLRDHRAPQLDRYQPQRLIKAWLKQQAIPVLDLLPSLRSADPLSDGRRHVYHLQDTHLNARGNRIAGEAMAEFLNDLLIANELELPLAAMEADGRDAGAMQLRGTQTRYAKPSPAGRRPSSDQPRRP
jgi:hypothetical protein